eukprot:11167579-Lingulodinium_polyedra.AAC.1
MQGKKHRRHASICDRSHTIAPGSRQHARPCKALSGRCMCVARCGRRAAIPMPPDPGWRHSKAPHCSGSDLVGAPG